MVDRLRHLDLLLQLQGELFEDTLKEAVTNIFLIFPNHVLLLGFDCFPVTNGNLFIYFFFQKWPCTDVGPVEALLVTFAYEKRTGEVVTKEDMANGKLGKKLQDCDFETAHQVHP